MRGKPAGSVAEWAERFSALPGKHAPTAAAVHLYWADRSQRPCVATHCACAAAQHHLRSLARWRPAAQPQAGCSWRPAGGTPGAPAPDCRWRQGSHPVVEMGRRAAEQYREASRGLRRLAPRHSWHLWCIRSPARNSTRTRSSPRCVDSPGCTPQALPARRPPRPEKAAGLAPPHVGLRSWAARRAL